MKPTKGDVAKTTKDKIDKIKSDVLDKDKCKKIAQRLTLYIKNEVNN